MSDNKWTNEQLDAIIEKDCSMLVAAAAGAGKTAVLVERIIRKITDEKNPVDIDRLLIVTFTNAAAAEMRERIAAAITSALEKNPGSKNIQRQMTLLNKASITTIHSFCLEVIRRDFQNINIDPGFRIADETEAALMKLEVLNGLFEDQYEREAANEDFFELLECYGGNRDDKTLQDMVLDLYGFIQSSPWPGVWLEEMSESFNISFTLDFAETIWGIILIDYVMLELEALKKMMSGAIDLLKSSIGLEKYYNVFCEDLASLDALLNISARVKMRFNSNSRQGEGEFQPGWDDIFKSFQGFEFNRLPGAGKDCDKGTQEYVKGIRDDVKAAVRGLREKIFMAESASIINDLRTLYPVIKCLTRLVFEFSEKFAEVKSRKSLVDFNDLEHFCLDILAYRDENGRLLPSAAAKCYRERFEEILVDEYQDSNLVQEIIIGMISRVDEGKPNVFMVGDVKQSIYRFRQARPELFLDKYNSYSDGKDSPYRKILLYKNFRSRSEIVCAVNFIFRQIMSERAGELDYTDKEALNPGAVFSENLMENAFAGGEIELHLIQTGSGDEGLVTGGIQKDAGGMVTGSGDEESGDSGDMQPDADDMPDRIQCEARVIAKRICELMLTDEQGRDFHVYDKNKRDYRKIEYRDIVILLRTTKNWSDIFMEELSNKGIPAFADTGTGFFKTSEVQVILSLLQIIDNPLQDIPLLSVLRSPIISFSTDELAELRLTDRKSTLYDALVKLSGQATGEASRKAASFLNDLSRWRDMSFYMSADQLLWKLYGDTGYYGMVGAMPAGEQRQANLRKLFDRARQFEETSYKGLFNFINFVEKLKSSRGDLGSAKILGENDNVVRIMSIHKSKGLEFPVVILAGCGKKFNLQDMNKSILFHQDLGFGPDFVDHRKRLAYPSLPKQAVRIKMKAETLSEEMRILYVALTRAREKLIITGTVADVPGTAAKWVHCAGTQEHRLPAYEMLKGCTFLDWICPALLRHKGCNALREAAGTGEWLNESLLDDPSIWKIKIWNISDITVSKAVRKKALDDFTLWLENPGTDDSYNELSGEIIRKLSWNYAYSQASKIPAKISVTELKRRFNAELSEEIGIFPGAQPVLIGKPMFLEEKRGLSPAEAGTILHFVMQHIDFKHNDIEAQIAQMVDKALITDQQAKSVKVSKIRRFLESPLGRRMQASSNVNREVPFNMEIPCCELYNEIKDLNNLNETLLLQGVIDCFFEEHDGLVLLDYKTDFVPDGKTEVIRERYRLQLSYYARALEMLTGRMVKEKYIYFFWNGEVLEF